MNLQSQRRIFSKRLLARLLLTVATACVSPAHAADGCLVLLCLAAPSWKNIPQCIDPVRQVLRDLSRGRPFPTCQMSGNGSAAANSWASAPLACPPQYTREIPLESGTSYACAWDGVIDVQVASTPWSRIWWSMAGDSVTEYLPAAKASLGKWDNRFDDDLAAWQAAKVAPVQACSVC